MLLRLCVALVCISLPALQAADTFAVLPFSNTTQERGVSSNMDWIGESIADTVREGLASSGSLVVEREDRDAAYRRLGIRPYALLTRASALKIGEALDVDKLLYGQFEFVPAPDKSVPSRGSLKIVARILDVRHLRGGPEYIEAGPLEDLAGLQSHLALQTLQFVTPKTAPSDAQFHKNRPVIRVEAIENYVRGLLAQEPEHKLRFFTQAYKLDSRFSPPCFQLGNLHWSRKNYRSAAEWYQRVSEQDTHFREAHFFLGLSRYYGNDYPGAQRAFQLVALAVPLNEVYNNLGLAQLRSNQPGAVESLRRALDGDPNDPVYHFNVGYALWREGQFPAAAERFRAVLERSPEDAEARHLLARSTSGSGPSLDDTTQGRVKETYEEAAYQHLKGMLERK